MYASQRPPAQGATVAELRSLLAAGLRARRAELEREILARLYGIADTSGADPAYVHGMRGSVAVAIDYALDAIERGEERTPPPPPALLAQARMAARHGVALAVVLRRYVASYLLIGEFLAAEAQARGLPPGATPAQLLRGRASLLDRLLAAVSDEYEREASSRVSSTEERRAERVQRLLAGESIDAVDLAYDLEGHHTGLIATGSACTEAIRGLAERLERPLLVIRRDEKTAWAWLGGRRATDTDDIVRLVSSVAWPRDTILTVGEPGEGVAGWRLTHEQAAAALPIALRRQEGLVRYAEVASLASALQDELLICTLRRLYLDPLRAGKSGGAVLRETLRAFLDAGRNTSAAAAALGVKRHTVTNRLRDIETRLGRPLGACIAEIELALRLEELEPSQC